MWGRKKKPAGNPPPRRGVTSVGEGLGKTQGQQKILPYFLDYRVRIINGDKAAIY